MQTVGSSGQHSVRRAGAPALSHTLSTSPCTPLKPPVKPARRGVVMCGEGALRCAMSGKH